MIVCIQVNCEESPEWIVPCSSDPPTVDDEGLDTWFKIGKVLTYMCCIHIYMYDSIYLFNIIFLCTLLCHCYVHFISNCPCH